MSKIELENQIADWSAELVEGAAFDDLDPDAVTMTRNKFSTKFKLRPFALNMIRSFRDNEFIDKIGLTVKGQATNAALILLGKPESAHFLGDAVPEIVIKNPAGETVKTFTMPLLTAVDELMKSIACIDYGYINQDPPLPEGGSRYDAELVNILMHNCIAHHDYHSGSIEITEYEDKLVFTNSGSFIPGTLDAVMEEGYKAPSYRNKLIYDALVEINAISSEYNGIPKIFEIQKEKERPLPIYELGQDKVSVTILGK